MIRPWSSNASVLSFKRCIHFRSLLYRFIQILKTFEKCCVIYKHHSTKVQLMFRLVLRGGGSEWLGTFETSKCFRTPIVVTISTLNKCSWFGQLTKWLWERSWIVIDFWPVLPWHEGCYGSIQVYIRTPKQTRKPPYALPQSRKLALLVPNFEVR